MIVLFGTPIGAEILYVTRGRPIIFVDICVHHTTTQLKSAATSKERLWYICKRCLLVYIQSAPSKGWPLNKTRCCAIRIEADAVHCQSNTEQQNAAPPWSLINPKRNVTKSTHHYTFNSPECALYNILYIRHTTLQYNDRYNSVVLNWY